MDNACLCESEHIPFNSSRFLDDLASDMGICSSSFLAAQYPELTFAVVHAAGRPKGYDLVEPVGKGRWMTANWRRVAATPQADNSITTCSKPL